MQNDNNGLLGGSLFGSRKTSEQVNTVVAENGRGQTNHNHQVVDQTDGSLIGGSTLLPGLGLTTKEAHQVNEVVALEGTVNFNTLDVNQRDSSAFGGLFQKQTAQQDNILVGSGELIGNTLTVSQGGFGLLGKRSIQPEQTLKRRSRI